MPIAQLLEEWGLLSDQQVVARVLAGETALFEVLMRRHNERLYRAARAILKDEAEAEDVMQQAYLNAYRHLRQFDGRSQFSTWLTRIAVNRAIRIGHGTRRSLEIVTPDSTNLAIEQAAAPELDPEHTMYGHELQGILESLIDQLPDPFRVVFVLREVEGLSTAETAACLSINEDTVKTRLHRAKRLLRERLDRRLGPAAGSVYRFHLTRCDRVVAGVMSALRCSLPNAAHPERLRHPAGGDRRDA